MQKFIIKGQKKLSGSVKISGAKNAVLPVMASCMLCRGKFILRNVPWLKDIEFMAKILTNIGVKISYYGAENTMSLDTTKIHYQKTDYDIVRKMRASIYVLSPQLAIFGKAKVSFPGGCAIGTRPVNFHLKAIEALGAKVKIEHGNIIATVKNLTGATIFFEKVSVGATVNTLMASVLAKGKTTIKNAAKEPEITNLTDFLISMGAKIKGRGTSTLVIEGVDRLFATNFTIIPDRIEAGTFLLAGAITKSKIKVENCNPTHLDSLLEKMRETGCKFVIDNSSIELIPPKIVRSVKKIVTAEYPGFPTDLQAQFMAYMTLSKGICIIEDVVFPDRFMHVTELCRLGAKITLEKNIAIIEGVETLSGAKIMATDLRASAALILAGLGSFGTTEISRIYHIDRGYQKIEAKLSFLMANIKRI